MKITAATIIVLFMVTSYVVHGQLIKKIDIVNLKSKPIIEGDLNGKSAYFLLDTGSDISILNIKDYKSYGYKVFPINSDNTSVEALGGTSKSLKRAGGLKLYMDKSNIYTAFYAYDLSNIINSLYTNTKLRVIGIIGSDIMRKYNFNIDYKNKQVSFDDILKKKDKKKITKSLLTNVNADEY